MSLARFVQPNRSVWFDSCCAHEGLVLFTECATLNQNWKLVNKAEYRYIELLLKLENNDYFNTFKRSTLSPA